MQLATGVVAGAAAGAAAGCLMMRRRWASGAAASALVQVVPAAAGERLAEADTPCLCVDLQAVDVNKARLHSLVSAHPGVTARPIVKAHKCVSMARYQLAAPSNQGRRTARGVCCAKVCEAEAMLAGGLTDILVSNEIIGARKLRRLSAAMCRAGVSSLRIVADSAEGVRQLAAAAAEAGVGFDVLVEVSCGQKRCGVASPEEAAEVARAVRAAGERLRLVGIQAYQGAAQHIRSKVAMESEIDNVARIAEDARAALAQEGLFDVPPDAVVVTGGGSGTLEFEMRSGVFTEVQPGSYLFNDADYSKNLGPDGAAEEEARWKASLFVLTTVMSRTVGPHGGYCIVDAGIKAHSIDSGMPRLYGRPDVECVNGGDEHFKLVFPPGEAVPEVGEKLFLQPGHVDPTFNMHDHVVVFRSTELCFSSAELLAADPKVEDVWPIEARGPGF